MNSSVLFLADWLHHTGLGSLYIRKVRLQHLKSFFLLYLYKKIKCQAQIPGSYCFRPKTHFVKQCLWNDILKFLDFSFSVQINHQELDMCYLVFLEELVDLVYYPKTQVSNSGCIKNVQLLLLFSLILFYYLRCYYILYLSCLEENS